LGIKGFTLFSIFGIFSVSALKRRIPAKCGVYSRLFTPFMGFLRKDNMSRTCDICGKHTVTGNKVSHAKNRTRRTWKPNLVNVKTDLGGTTAKLKICTRCLKSDYITKKV